MVAILPAALGVVADRLDMAVGLRAEPGALISRRQANRVQPIDLVAIGDASAVGVKILPVAAALLAGDAGDELMVDIGEHPALKPGSGASFRIILPAAAGAPRGGAQAPGRTGG